MTKDEALKMAIDFLDGSYEAHNVRKACQEALEQPAQEPIAWMAKDENCTDCIVWERDEEHTMPLYTHPVQPKPLTDAERQAAGALNPDPLY